MSFGVFIHRADSIYDDSPAERYQFPRQYLASHTHPHKAVVALFLSGLGLFGNGGDMLQPEGEQDGAKFGSRGSHFRTGVNA